MAMNVYESQTGVGAPAIGNMHDTPGYDALMGGPAAETEMPESFSPNGQYERYLRMHKVLPGVRGAQQLVEIYESLCQERLPRYLAAAGSAVVEAAMVQQHKPAEDRLALLQRGVECWKQALQTQKVCNDSERQYLTEYSAPYRLGLDIAIAPLLGDMIMGEVRPETCRSVFEDCMNIAQANAVRIRLMEYEANQEGRNDHAGFGYECNALLAFNSQLSETWFMIPSMIRSDNGHHHPQQTHDLLVVHQNGGTIQSMVPVEVKASASARDRSRYKALLMRGKMHLSVDGRHTPEHTLNAIAASYEGRATDMDMVMAGQIQERVVSMIRDYCAGEALGQIATSRSLVKFHDNAMVAANHPGLLSKAS